MRSRNGLPQWNSNSLVRVMEECNMLYLNDIKRGEPGGLEKFGKQLPVDGCTRVLDCRIVVNYVN